MNILTAILGRKNQTHPPHHHPLKKKKPTHPKQEHLRTSREPIVEPFM